MSNEYKYKLHYLIMRMPMADSKNATIFLPKYLKISSRTFERWVSIRVDDPKEIPANALLKLAYFFKVEPFELYQYPANATDLDEQWQEFKANNPVKLIITKYHV